MSRFPTLVVVMFLIYLAPFTLSANPAVTEVDGLEPLHPVGFRTVHLDDALADSGAPMEDSNCTGTTMGDYLRAADLEHFPEELIRRYLEGRRLDSI